MPSVYSLHCESCDHGDVRFTSWYRAVWMPSGEIISLDHPLEDAILKEQGFTWRRATLEGRLLSIQPRVCARCGCLNDIVTVGFFWPGGCLGPALIAGIVSLAVFQTSWLTGLGIFLVTAFVLSIVMAVLFQFLYGHRVRHLSQTSCRRCGCPTLLTAQAAAKRRLDCPHCGKKSMVVEVAGKS